MKSQQYTQDEHQPIVASGFSAIFFRLSQSIARIELFFSGAFMGLIFLLLFINIITRLNSTSLYWIDEAAVTCMVWMALLAASAGVHYRSTISITLLKDRLSAEKQKKLDVLIDSVLIVFFSFFLYLIIIVFDPYGLLITYKADIGLFSSNTFNFIYEEPTMTLGIKKFFVWLILPIFAINSLLHSLANFLVNYNK